MKHGKISAIKREYKSSGLKTMQSELASRGYTRMPGTAVHKYPYKEMDGKYRTGLDPNASYIARIKDETERQVEKERVKTLCEKLTNALSLDLSPHSKFWNHSHSTSTSDATHVQPAKLIDGDNFFDFASAWQELTFAWLRVHPTIASSYQAWERGEYPADTQFYVADEEIETAVTYKKKQNINKAITLFEGMSPTKRKKIGRVMGLPITEDTKEEMVYNQVDTLLKQSEFKNGKFQGLSPVTVFLQFAQMDEKLLTVKDIVKQAIAHSVYRPGLNGKLFEGQAEVAKDEDDMVKHLMNDDNQLDFLSLENKLKTKKLAAI
jgi:hypothetical protein